MRGNIARYSPLVHWEHRHGRRRTPRCECADEVRQSRHGGDDRCARVTYVHDPGDGTPHPKQRNIPSQAPRYVTWLPPDSASQRLALTLAGRGATVTTQSVSGLAGFVTTVKKPSIVLGLLLMLLCLVPGVLYFAFAGGSSTEAFSISLTPTSAGTRVGWNGQGQGLAVAAWACAQLPGMQMA